MFENNFKKSVKLQKSNNQIYEKVREKYLKYTDM